MTDQTVLRRDELIPGHLSVSVHSHDVSARDGLVSCWSFVSEGFAPLGHPELVFTVRRALNDARDAAPTEAIKLFTAVWHRVHSVEGAVLQSGDVIAIQPGTFLGRDDVRGVGVIDAMPLDDLTLDSRHKTLIALVGEELEVARDYGLSRVVARLGQDEGMFPSAPWFDRARKSVARNDRSEKTILGRCMRVTARAGSATVEGDRIVLELPTTAAGALREPIGELPEDTALVVIVPIDPRADGLLVWRPGDRELTAIGPSDAVGAKVSGNFIALVPNQPEDGSNPLEDGFAVRMTNDSWARVRRALAAAEAIELAAGDDSLPFSLRWFSRD
ncbi:MAG: hypothetical protein U0269_25985 [Polyangiales bacterium]